MVMECYRQNARGHAWVMASPSPMGASFDFSQRFMAMMEDGCWQESPEKIAI